MWSESSFWLKLACLFALLFGVGGVFVLTPALSTPTLLSVVITLLLSPLVVRLERRGYPRGLSILFLLGGIGVLFSWAGVWITQNIAAEWESFATAAPRYFDLTLEKLRETESAWKERIPLLRSARITATLLGWAQSTGKWFIENGPALMGQILTWLMIVPILTFVLLYEGRAIRKHIFELVPNRIFESTFMIFTQITQSISGYIRAKLIEASLVGALTMLGLWIVGAPYVLILGVIAGVTNILPYVGPVLGAAPAILIAVFDPTNPGLLLPVVIVYLLANVIDTVVIFPLVVGKLVNLHPVTLIIAVIVGQNYYGLIGMLVSVPVVSGLKIIFGEVYAAIYDQRAR